MSSERTGSDTVRYWDTSALLKLYVAEAGSEAVWRVAAPAAGPLATSSITAAEVLCALHQKEVLRGLPRGRAEKTFERFTAHIADGRIYRIPYDSQVVDELRNLVRRLRQARRPMVPRSLDAIHLSTALACKADAIVSTDQRLRRAATVVGLDVLP